MQHSVLDPGTKRLFLRALELEEGTREQWLEQRCRDDPQRRAAVLALLKADDATVASLLEDCRIDVPGLSPGDRVGPYVIEEQLGEGSFSVVHAARQLHPVERRVALKVLRPGIGDDRVAARRIADETQVLASLSHHSIATVFDTGTTDDGCTYIAMERVPGQPITRFADEAGLGLHERVELVRQACEAVRHAHLKGLIHLDLKPGNILAWRAETGELRLKVIDFGIARATPTHGTGDTVARGPELADQPGAGDPRVPTMGLVGTPAYMAPEQARTGGVDARSDVFALGAVLHELITGCLPFGHPEAGGDGGAAANGTPDHGLQHWIAARRAPPASSVCRTPVWRRELERDLDWIIARCLAPDPAARYQGAGELADDLCRWNARVPIRARPSTRRYRLERLHARHPVATVAAGVGTAVLLGSITLTSIALSRSVRAESRTRDALGLAESRGESLSVERTRLLGTNQFLTDILAGPATWSLAEELGIPAADVRIRDLLERAGQRLESRFAADPATRVTLELTLAETWLDLEEIEHAEAELERLERDLPLIDASPTTTGHFQRLRGVLLTRMGSPEEAIALHTAAMAACRTAGEWTEWIRNGNARVTALWSMQRHEEAIEVAEDVVRTGTMNVADASPSVGTALSNLAVLIGNVRGYDAALAVHDRAVRYFEHPELRDHRDAMVARANRLVNLRYLGRDEEAHAEGLILLEERRRVLGPRHPHTIASELGAIEQLIHGGAVDQANLDLDRVRDVLAAMPDDRHRPLRVRAATTQAMLHRIEGDSHAAVEESERALALQAEEHGPDALVTHFSRLNLVLALLDAGRPEAAEPLFERVEADPAFMALGGWAEALRSLAEGRLLEWKGVPDTAAARIRDAHALLQRIAEPGNPHLDFAAAALGRVERP